MCVSGNVWEQLIYSFIALYDLTAGKLSVLYVERCPVLGTHIFSKLRALLGIGASSLGEVGFGQSRIGGLEENQGSKVLCCEDWVWEDQGWEDRCC